MMGPIAYIKWKLYCRKFKEALDDWQPQNTERRDNGMGQTYLIHNEGTCAGDTCCFHNPTDPNNHWPFLIRFDKFLLVERICKHGVGHPDRDSVAWLEGQGLECMDVHGCCLDETTMEGCCSNPANGCSSTTGTEALLEQPLFCPDHKVDAGDCYQLHEDDQ